MSWRSGARGSSSSVEDSLFMVAWRASTFGWIDARRERIEEIWRMMNSAVVDRGCSDGGVDVERNDRGEGTEVAREVFEVRAAWSFEISTALEAVSVLRVWLRE